MSTGSQQRATIAAARLDRAGVVLGGIGLASSLFVVLRLLETWRVTPHMSSHLISILGQKLSYPAANLAALVVLALAALGLLVTVIAMTAAVQELLATRRFGRLLTAERLPRVDRAFVIDDDRPHAFCAGLWRPRVYVSRGAVATLDPAALRAVLAHEEHHVSRRDPLRYAIGRVLSRALLFVPGRDQLLSRRQAFTELGADETAIGAGPGQRSALARAMLTFADSGEQVGIDPARVDHLLGEPPNWRLPLLLLLAAVAVIALLVAVAVLAGRVASGSATLAPPFLSRQPCVVVLATIPAALGLMAVRRRWR